MEEKVNIFSKEAIRARMIQNATSLWGLKNAQSLDPFVKLLIEAFSTEIFKVSNEVNNIKTRMLEKLSRLLTPTIYTVPQPAHAIAFAQPIEAATVLYSNQEFFNQKKLPIANKKTKDGQLDMPFTPVDNVKLINAKIAAMFTGNSSYLMDNQNNKIPIAKISGAGLPYGNIWLAVEIDNDFEEKINELCLYFTCPDFDYLDWVYSLLPYGEFSINNQFLGVEKGITFHKEKIESGYGEIFNEYTPYKKISDTVKNIYAPNFITLNKLPPNINKLKTSFPSQLDQFKTQLNLSAHLKEEYLWICIQLPPQYNFSIMENFSFMLNAFPVINRKWKQNQCKFDVAGNNIPLLTVTGEHYLMIDEVVDAGGRKYDEIPYGHAASLQKGLYSVRVSGMERFDERNAVDLINYSLELTRDEVAAYGNINRDIVRNVLKEMVIHMKRLQRIANIAEGNIQQVPSYVIAEPVVENEYMYAAYWVTNCSRANNLRTGMVMTSQQCSTLQNGAITLLTNTVGGQEQQRGMGAVQAYKYALTTRDRIITLEDIKNFCRMELRDQIKEITVKKGTGISQKPKEGFIRTLEVNIIPLDYELYNEVYWNSKAKSLKQQIELRAIDGLEYKVFFNK